MRWLVAFSFLFLALLPLPAEDWTAADGTVYKDVVVVQVADDGLTITHAGGTAKIPYYNLPLAVQKQYGHDPDTLANSVKDAAEAEAAKKAAALAAEKLLEAQKKQQAFEADQVKALDAARKLNHSAMSSARAAMAGLPELPNRTGDKLAFPGAEYSYNKFLNLSYLDSPVVAAAPLPAPATPNPAAHTVLSLRIVTDGVQPQQPEKIVATVLAIGTVWKLLDTRDILFLVDGVPVPISDTQVKDSDFLAGLGQVTESLSFYLTPAEAQAIVNGKNVVFSIGIEKYTLDPAGVANLKKFVAALQPLPPRDSALVRSYSNITSQMPSLPMLISKTCEYIILGIFSLGAFLGFCACIVAGIRFIKW